MFSDILLTVDFDRTLTAPDSTVPQRNLDAIHWFMENGGVFTVNTGRSVPMTVLNLWDQVPVNAPLLLYNGSAAYDLKTGRITRCNPIDLDPKLLCEDLAEKFPQLHVEIQGVNAHCLTRRDPGWEAYCDHNRCRWEYVTTDTIPRPFLKIAVNGQFRDVTVDSMCLANEEDLKLFDRLTDYVQTRYGDKIDAFRACARILDLHAKGCSKLRSARDLQKELGRRILVCVGDAPNDLPMLQGADYAYCPADGILADRFENVCACAQGAVADVILYKIPELLKK